MHMNFKPKLQARLGIVGGVGPDASARLYQLVARAMINQQPDIYPDIVVHNIALPRYLERAFVEGRISDNSHAAMKALLHESALLLARCEVDVVALACNTLHAFLPTIQRASGRPVLDMEQATLDAFSRSGYKNAALLTTSGAQGLGVYSHWHEPSRNLILADDRWAPMVADCIRRLLLNPDDASVGVELAEAVSGFAPDADAIIFGCTELSAMSSGSTFTLPVIDSLQVLADECVSALFERGKSNQSHVGYIEDMRSNASEMTTPNESAEIREVEAQEPETGETIGAELELLVVDGQLNLAAVSRDLIEVIQSAIDRAARCDNWRDAYGGAPLLGYDTAHHLLELNLGVYRTLEGIVEATWRSTELINQTLGQHNLYLLTLAHHPTASDSMAFRNAKGELRYVDAFGKRGLEGGAGDRLSRAQSCRLKSAYGINGFRLGRGLDRSRVSRSMGVHVWNGLDTNKAVKNIAVMQATSWLTNLITANSPFEDQALTARDCRLRVWEGFLSSSVIDSDHSLHEPALIGALSLASYYRHLLERVPFSFDDPDNLGQTVLPIQEEQQFTTLELLLRGSCRVVDSKGKTKSIPITLGNLLSVDGWNFSNSRLRLRHPDFRCIDPDGSLGRKFARAIYRDDGYAVEQLLAEGLRNGSNGHARLCLEGRVNATVLPGIQSNFLPLEAGLQQYRGKEDRISAPMSYINDDYVSYKTSVLSSDNGWDGLVAPFVLQTAIIRSTDSILGLLEGSDLSWRMLNYEIPDVANRVGDSFGFKATVTNIRGRQIHLGSLARQVWGVARSSLTASERVNLKRVIDYIDTVVAVEMAPAERLLRIIALRSGKVSRDIFGFPSDFYGRLGSYSFGADLHFSDLVVPQDAAAPKMPGLVQVLDLTTGQKVTIDSPLDR